MKKKKRLYRSVIQIEVLSDYPYDFIGLDLTHEDITDGDCSGKTKVLHLNQVIEGLDAVKAVKDHNINPDFFLMDDEGFINLD